MVNLCKEITPHPPFSHSSQHKDSIAPFLLSSLQRHAPVVLHFSHERATPSSTERYHTPAVPPSSLGTSPTSHPRLLRPPQDTQRFHLNPHTRVPTMSTAPQLWSPRKQLYQTQHLYNIHPFSYAFVINAPHLPRSQTPFRVNSLTTKSATLNTAPHIFWVGKCSLGRVWGSTHCFLEASRNILRVDTKRRGRPETHHD